MTSRREQNTPITDKAFKISLYLKGTDGLLELLGGLLLLIIKPEQLNNLARLLTQHELSTDSHDFIASHILKSAHSLTSASLVFGALYLLSHGVLKVVLVVEVLRKHLWAYAALIVVTAGFVVYQVYRLAYHLSAGLIFLTLFDLLIIYLTQKEYRKKRLDISV
ncbi:MAG TPA: DUF2127 domain-containing protein [Candidatus Saccharimonadales bacterium]|nr:DUF2127 domain-containing protein [Candidatus Saccharimonadales bacterium]